MTQLVSRLLACGSGALAAAAAVTVFLAAGAEGAGQATAGRQKAAQCRPCHGIDGVARLPNAATIAGESEIYLAKQLKAFRAGERQDPQMSIIAEGLSDQDIADLAAWYGSIKITVEVPQ